LLEVIKIVGGKRSGQVAHQERVMRMLHLEKEGGRVGEGARCRMRKVGSGTCTFLLTINRGKGEKKAGGEGRERRRKEEEREEGRK